MEDDLYEIVRELGLLTQTAVDFERICGDYRTAELRKIVSQLRDAVGRHQQMMQEVLAFLERYAAWLEKKE